jgi:hypothetical protein
MTSTTGLLFHFQSAFDIELNDKLVWIWLLTSLLENAISGSCHQSHSGHLFTDNCCLCTRTQTCHLLTNLCLYLQCEYRVITGVTWPLYALLSRISHKIRWCLYKSIDFNSNCHQVTTNASMISILGTGHWSTSIRHYTRSPSDGTLKGTPCQGSQPPSHAKDHFPDFRKRVGSLGAVREAQTLKTEHFCC